MSSDEQAPALTHEQVLAVLVEMRDEDGLRAARLARDAATVARIKQKQLAAPPFTEAADADTRAAALSAAIDALGRQHEDSALLDLVHRCRIQPYWSDKRQGWQFMGSFRYLPREQEEVLIDLLESRPKGWPTARDALRAVAAVIGKDGGEQ